MMANNMAFVVLASGSRAIDPMPSMAVAVPVAAPPIGRIR